MTDPDTATAGDATNAAAAGETVSLTVYSDYVCPFCYLGRRSLERYRDQRSEDAPDLTVDWHPFDLRSQTRRPDGSIDPAAGDKDDDYYEQARENIRRLKEQYDAEMAIDLATDVDSLDAQVVSYRVKQTHPYETWLAFDEAVFAALWQDEADIGDPDVLASLAEDVGIDPAAVRSALADESLRETVTDRFEAAKRRGITGVPTFAYDGHAARGAVPPEHLRRLIEGP